jgi:uncharacterized membrane protein YebE (DUF533 family)
MLLRIAALGALGYAGYKYYQKNGLDFGLDGGTSGEPATASDPDIDVAGGPISGEATIVHAGEGPLA